MTTLGEVVRLSNDIARCTNEECPVKESCLRWLAARDKKGYVFFRGEPINGSYCEEAIPIIKD